jgi:hypothetical protein
VSFGAAFLEYPDLFPARRAGERCGERELAVELPGGPYLFTGLDKTQEEIVRDRLGGHCRNPTEAGAFAVETQVFRVARRDFLEIDTRGWEYALDLDYQPSAVRMAGLELMGRLDWGGRAEPREGSPAAGGQAVLRGGLWTSAGEEDAFYSAFENFFRVLFAYRLLDSGGALLHSAGVADNRGAFLFLGHSGAGKSTLARLSLESGRTILSDDMNALLPGEPGPALARLPFTGDFRAPSAAQPFYPLRALCRLEKGEGNCLAPMGAAEALATLVACSPSVNRDPYRQERLLANLTALVRSVPAHVLTFSVDGGFWELLEGRPHA